MDMNYSEYVNLLQRVPQRDFCMVFSRSKIGARVSYTGRPLFLTSWVVLAEMS